MFYKINTRTLIEQLQSNNPKAIMRSRKYTEECLKRFSKGEYSTERLENLSEIFRIILYRYTSKCLVGNNDGENGDYLDEDLLSEFPMLEDYLILIISCSIIKYGKASSSQKKYFTELLDGFSEGRLRTMPSYATSDSSYLCSHRRINNRKLWSEINNSTISVLNLIQSEKMELELIASGLCNLSPLEDKCMLETRAMELQSYLSIFSACCREDPWGLSFAYVDRLIYMLLATSKEASLDKIANASNARVFVPGEHTIDDSKTLKEEALQYPAIKLSYEFFDSCLNAIIEVCHIRQLLLEDHRELSEIDLSNFDNYTHAIVARDNIVTKIFKISKKIDQFMPKPISSEYKNVSLCTLYLANY